MSRIRGVDSRRLEYISVPNAGELSENVKKSPSRKTCSRTCLIVSGVVSGVGAVIIVTLAVLLWLFEVESSNDPPAQPLSGPPPPDYTAESFQLGTLNVTSAGPGDCFTFPAANETVLVGGLGVGLKVSARLDLPDQSSQSRSFEKQTTAETTVSVSSFTQSEDGAVTFMVDHVGVGRVTATKINSVSPGYTEYVYRNGALELQSDVTAEARCAYSGFAEAPAVLYVSLFTCGHTGPRITITFSNSTVLHMKKASASEQMDGVYVVTQKQTARSLSWLQTDVIAANHRRRSLLDDTGETKVLYFNYVFVSDKKRYEMFNESTNDVMVDTLEEVAMLNAIYLIGNKFSPQIQFQIDTQIIWTDYPSQFDSANLNRSMPEGNVFLSNFHQWIIETTYFNITGWIASASTAEDRKTTFNTSLITGENKQLGDRADGWHLLTGYDKMIRINDTDVSGMAPIDYMCVNYKAGCERIFTEHDSNGKIDKLRNWHLLYWQDYYAAASFEGEPCYPSLAIGWTRVVIDDADKGRILAHEIGHNLGFNHVYNKELENGKGQLGDIDGCMQAEPHNGSAIMGYKNRDSSISWSNCSVEKFLSNFQKNKYACAERSSTALAEKFNPLGAHHLSPPPALPPPALPPPEEVWARIILNGTNVSYPVNVTNGDRLQVSLCSSGTSGVKREIILRYGNVSDAVAVTTATAAVHI